MKIIYIANIRIPTEKAHGIQIMKMCEAFAGIGFEVELVVPKRLNDIKDNVFDYYDIKNDFSVKKLLCIDLVKFGKIGFIIQSLSFSIFSFFYVIFKKNYFIYSRDEMPLFLLSFLKKNIIYEAHMPRFNFLTKRFNKIVTISNGLKDFYVKKGVSEDKIIITHDAVDIKKFNISISKEDARKMLDLPLDKKIILYAGHLYGWKGVDTLAESAKCLTSKELVVFVGGTDTDVSSFKNKYKNIQNILILGKKPHKEIPYYLKSADVLVLPNSEKSDISKYYTSPMKLFEYMASGTPVVASELSSTKEILNNGNAIFVYPDNPKALSVGIEKILRNEELTGKISNKALSDVKDYTWTKRAENIIDFVK